MDIKIIIFAFFIYSFIGWLIEVFYTEIETNNWINRGFLLGPICPIYGIACLVIMQIFDKTEDIISVALKIMLICAFLEYFTSYIFEKIFHARWWDYSKRKFNINGRVCLETLILFAVAGIIFVYLINPIVIAFINKIPNLLLTIITGLLTIIFLTDLYISSVTIFKFRKLTKNDDKNSDRTVEISKYVRNKLSEKSKLLKRLVNAFPHLKAKTKINIKRRNV